MNDRSRTNDEGSRGEGRGPEPVLIVDGVTKTYGHLRALDAVSLAVCASELVMLLGPNGAGKSTLMQLLTGLFIADSGSIRVMGYDMRQNAVPALAQLGVVFQQPTLDLELSVSANLKFQAGLHGLDRRTARARIDAELARFGLVERRADPARTLSGGNRRRVELARALLNEPRVMLMDEPTVGLDLASRRDILDYVVDLKTERGLGVLWTTHLADETEQADRIIVLHEGRILFDGTPAAVLDHTKSSSIRDAFFALTGDPGSATPPHAAD